MQPDTAPVRVLLRRLVRHSGDDDHRLHCGRLLGGRSHRSPLCGYRNAVARAAVIGGLITLLSGALLWTHLRRRGGSGRTRCNQPSRRVAQSYVSAVAFLSVLILLVVSILAVYLLFALGGLGLRVLRRAHAGVARSHRCGVCRSRRRDRPADPSQPGDARAPVLRRRNGSRAEGARGAGTPTAARSRPRTGLAQLNLRDEDRPVVRSLRAT